VTPAALSSGCTLAGLVLERVLGRGAMGVVWLGVEEGLERPVAVKVLAPELAEDESFRERFLTEMRLAASLDHPHVCPVYRAGEEDGLLYLALRYVPGEDLGAAVARAALEPERALGLLHDLAGALDAAHAHGLLHRDVKPANVLLDESGNAYLADFGLARSDAGSQASVAGSQAGTLAYLAPERIEGAAATTASDLYAFACLAFCTLSGAPPFVREHDAALLFAQVRDAPPSLIEHGLGRLDPVFVRALAKRPEERYSSSRDLVEALAQALAGDESASGLPSAWPETLPRPQTAFVGRERELDRATEILATGAPLLTLTGPGGTGKTRLALELAARTAACYDSVHWVSLAALRDPNLLLPTIAKELDEPDRAPAETIGERRLLLALDNLEQLLPDASALLAELKTACPNLTLVVTSRAPLHVQAEHALPVPPLEQNEAIALFHRRAEHHGRGVTGESEATVAEICRRLDCLPLALELAAARLRLMSPAALLERLDQRLRLLAGGPRDAPARQQTLTATLDWSYDLLQPAERELLAGLTVFSGSFALEAAEAICAAELDTLEGLLDASLLRRLDDSPGGARYWLLAVVREYAATKLVELPSHDALHDAHAASFRDLAVRAKDELAADDVLTWLARLDADHDNVRAALAWAKRRHDGETVFGIATSMNQFWQTRGHLAEARQWLSEALDDELEAPAALRAKALLSASHIALRLGDLEAAERLCERNMELCEQTGDIPHLSQALSVLAVVSEYRGDFEVAADRHERALALARRQNDERALRMTVNYVALFELTRENYDRARSLFEEGSVLATRIGWRSTIAGSIYDLALVDGLAGEHDEVRRRLPEAISIFGELEDRECLAYAFIVLAAGEAESGRGERAATLLGTAESLFGDLGSKPEPLEQRLVDRALTASRAQLDAATWEQAHATGTGLSLEEAVELALADRLPDSA